ncbi:MAG: hypothetical protein JWN25_2679 [Verrucomicrobiales bacterium]|nr:hypothetical protein [Verrucomicrobiales bacterium]
MVQGCEKLIERMRPAALGGPHAAECSRESERALLSVPGPTLSLRVEVRPPFVLPWRTFDAFIRGSHHWETKWSLWLLTFVFDLMDFSVL